jgi:hypothetical protein
VTTLQKQIDGENDQPVTGIGLTLFGKPAKRTLQRPSRFKTRGMKSGHLS